MSQIEQALTRVSYLASRFRQHDRLMAMAGVSLDRAAVALLHQLATLFHRMVGDFLTHSGEDEADPA